MARKDKEFIKKISKKDKKELEVMYQKICGKWYVFTTVGDECYYTKLEAL